jgi:hypothetical protein
MAIQAGAGTPAQRSSGSGNLAELVSVILDKGIVIDAWARVSVIGIEILTVEARVVVSSVDTYLRYAEAIGLTALAAAPGQQGQAAGGQQGASQQQLPSRDEVMGYLEDHPEGVDLGEMQAYFDAPREELAGIVQDLVDDREAREDQEQYFPASGEEGEQEG